MKNEEIFTLVLALIIALCLVASVNAGIAFLVVVVAWGFGLEGVPFWPVFGSLFILQFVAMILRGIFIRD